MSPEISVALLGILGSVLVFFLGRWYERLDKSQRKIVEWGVTLTALMSPSQLGPISMSVDKGYITRKRVDKGKLLPVKSAYHFVIGVTNAGLDDLEKPEIYITLSDKASIIEVEPQSDQIPKDKIEHQRDPKRANVWRVIPPYVNSKDTLTISVLSINNASPKCEVIAVGPGIKNRRRGTSVEADSSSVVFPRIVALSIWAFILWLIIERANSIISTVP